MLPSHHPTVATDLARLRMREDHAAAARYRAAQQARRDARDARLVAEGRRPRRATALWRALVPRAGL